MQEDTLEILSRALKLPPEARAALAGTLLDSLDQEVDQEAESAWEGEIAKRLQAIDRRRRSDGSLERGQETDRRALMAEELQSLGTRQGHFHGF